MSDENDTTNSTDTRWKYIGTVLSAIMVLSLPVLLGLGAAGVISLGTVTQGWFMVYSTITLMAAAWAFGTDTLKEVYKLRSG